MLHNTGEHRHDSRKFFLLRKIFLSISLIVFNGYTYGQIAVPGDSLKGDPVKYDSVKIQQPADSTYKQYDIADLFVDIFNPKRKPGDRSQKPTVVTIIPNIAANPSIGAQIGIKAVAGKVLGKVPGTLMSIAGTSASITTKGIIYFYITHNVYTPGNKWNFQGNLVAAKTVTPDFGLGIGNASGGTEADKVLVNAGRKKRVLYSQYYIIREKIYKEVRKNLFAGLGASFEIRRKIDERDTTNSLTPYNVYSDRNGYARDHYLSNGLLFNVQYTTRDNLNRAYKGMYADAGFRVNQTWMGSTKSAVQFTTDFRKYVSLSTLRPEHVIAFWNWGSYLVSGTVPYLELPGTAKDPGSRSGRGYTVGYFNGPKYNYSEVEYRFPITRNKFVSGVTFFNIQTASDQSGTKLFQQWQPGGGAGLRILFNKSTRTNLCLDYAFGKFGSKGFFLGINEAF